MYRYEYITLLDTDEVIVPTNHTNWSDLMKDLVETTGSKVSWAFRNIYFFDEMLERNEGGFIPDIPPHLHHSPVWEAAASTQCPPAWDSSSTTDQTV